MYLLSTLRSLLGTVVMCLLSTLRSLLRTVGMCCVAKRIYSMKMLLTCLFSVCHTSSSKSKTNLKYQENVLCWCSWILSIFFVKSMNTLYRVGRQIPSTMLCYFLKSFMYLTIVECSLSVCTHHHFHIFSCLYQLERCSHPQTVAALRISTHQV